MAADADGLCWRLVADAQPPRLEIKGELDMAARFGGLAGVVAEAASCASVEIDLEDVTFLDGSGLSSLMDLVGRLAAVGVEVTFGRRSGRVDRYLDLVHEHL